MQMYSYRATERGIRERNSGVISEERAKRIDIQRASRQAELAEWERIERIRADSYERAKAYAQELKLAGFRYRPTIAEIERRACRVFDVTKSELHSNRRFRKLVFAKQFVMYWAVRLTPLSLPQIGRVMGGFDHTSVLHNKRIYPEKRAKMGRYLRPTR